VIGNAYRIENRFATQMVGERNLRAVAEVAGALPLMFAGAPDITDIGALLDVVDGVVLTGARANVHPTRFGTQPDLRHEPYDIHPDPNVVFADRHEVSLIPGGAFAQILGSETIRVNSLHGQGVLEPGERVIVEGVAEDGTIEAIRIADAPGFALGVQWHAEYDPQRNPINRALFQAFGEALAARKRAA